MWLNHYLTVETSLAREYTEPSSHCILFCFNSKKGINNKYLRLKNKMVLNRHICILKSKETNCHLLFNPWVTTFHWPLKFHALIYSELLSIISIHLSLTLFPPLSLFYLMQAFILTSVFFVYPYNVSLFCLFQFVSVWCPSSKPNPINK